MNNEVRKIYINSIPVYREECKNGEIKYVLYENDSLLGSVIFINTPDLVKEVEIIRKYIVEELQRPLKIKLENNE